MILYSVRGLLSLFGRDQIVNILTFVVCIVCVATTSLCHVVRKWPQAVHKQVWPRANKTPLIKIGGRLDFACRLQSVLENYRYGTQKQSKCFVDYFE